jgi:xanthine dehydrogenase molybdopterin-binding subunit B
MMRGADARQVSMSSWISVNDGSSASGRTGTSVIHGGTVQGVGLALMEEIQLRDGKIRNASFTDYLIPTILDVPPMKVHVLELADPDAPYGLRGVGEPPTVSSTPAVIAAVRAATGRGLSRIPLRPEHIVAADDHAAGAGRGVDRPGSDSGAWTH